MQCCFLHVGACPCALLAITFDSCPTSTSLSALLKKQVHRVLDTKESVQDTNLCFTENRVLLVQLLMEPLVSYVTYGLNLFLFQVGKDCSF